MSEPLTALAVFAAIFAVAAVRNVPVGIVMLAAAFGVGALLADMTLAAVLEGFPVGTMVILAGVTYFFGIARANGTIDRIIDAVLARIGSNVVVLPFAFFGLTASISAMGAPVGVFVMAPIGMPLARNHGIDPMLMGMAIAAGGATGAFAPTGLYGIITYGTTQDAGIALGPLTLFAVAAGANLAMVLAAFLAFGGRALLARRKGPSGAATAANDASAVAARAPLAPLARNQIVTVAFIVALLATLVVSSILGARSRRRRVVFHVRRGARVRRPARGPRRRREDRLGHRRAHLRHHYLRRGAADDGRRGFAQRDCERRGAAGADRARVVRRRGPGFGVRLDDRHARGARDVRDAARRLGRRASGGVHLRARGVRVSRRHLPVLA